jgi:hypothetical protein
MMNDSAHDRQADPPGGVGLCATCRQAQLIQSDKGTIFYRCRRSETDPDFPRYPKLPVLACRGYEA